MIKAIFFDLSGVLYQGDEVIPGAVETINRLEHGGLTLRFVTNTSRQTRSAVFGKLRGMGFQVDEEQLYTAPTAARAWCQAQNLTPYCLVHKNIKREFSCFESTQYDAVILGDAESELNYQNLDQAFQILMCDGTLIAVGENRYFRNESGLHLDAGPFVRALEYASGRTAIICGKPSPGFYHQVVASTPFEPNEILMIGDDVFGDIEGARQCGLQSCLVRTGKYREGDETLIDPPADVAKDVREAVNHRLPML